MKQILRFVLALILGILAIVALLLVFNQPNISVHTPDLPQLFVPVFM